jgi:hypothetical protein
MKFESMSIIAIIVAMVMAFLQVAQQSLKNKGEGHVPLVDPHTELWYEIDKVFTTLTYVIAVLTILQ